MQQDRLDADSYRALRIEYQDSVLRVTIDHPESPLNAVDDLLHRELTRLFVELRRERRGLRPSDPRERRNTC